MTLTVAQATAHIEHRLAGKAGDPYSGTWLVNNTGLWLTAAHPWRWLKSKTATLDTVAGQDYITLPSDVRSVVEIQPTDGRTRFFTLTTEDQLLKFRTEGTSSNLHTWGAVTHKAATDGAPSLVLDIWPTPTESSSDFYRVTYQRGWTRVTTDSDYVDIPEWMEPLFVAAVREMAVGLEEEDSAGVPSYARLEAFAQSGFFKRFAAQDGGVSSQLGTIRGGAAEAPAFSWDSRFEWPSIPDPS